MCASNLKSKFLACGSLKIIYTLEEKGDNYVLKCSDNYQSQSKFINNSPEWSVKSHVVKLATKRSCSDDVRGNKI